MLFILSFTFALSLICKSRLAITTLRLSLLASRVLTFLLTGVEMGDITCRPLDVSLNVFYWWIPSNVWSRSWLLVADTWVLLKSLGMLLIALWRVPVLIIVFEIRSS